MTHYIPTFRIHRNEGKRNMKLNFNCFFRNKKKKEEKKCQPPILGVASQKYPFVCSNSITINKDISYFYNLLSYRET